jgi:dTDP-4-dehydrorhamnose 3,5-epimerase
MIFTETKLAGAFILDLERRGDNRGYFARTFCQNEFEAHGLKPVIAQSNAAFNKYKGTLRGMHFQFPPPRSPSSSAACAGRSSTSSSTCARRARRSSSTWPVELNEDNGRSLYVPERFAHGYQALEDNTETSYQVGEFYTPPRRAACRRTTPTSA